ncbi:MAG: GNAT family N-acetyltransferase, partial [Actinomycetota bacterium]|nr:GNAT family N-acetyltransferase [Actinomycetota bacterium]
MSTTLGTLGSAATAAGAPEHWEADAVLGDGGLVHIRPIRPDDADRLRRFHAGLSPQTVYNRFFVAMPTLSDRDIHRFTVVDHVDRVALVALIGDDIVGVVRYDRARLPDGRPSDEAEVAFVIADEMQGRGLGPLLLEHLAEAARERGVRRFVAETLPTNRRMIGVFATAGYGVKRRFEDGVVMVGFSLAPTDESVAVTRAREQRAEARSVARLLRPESVAVIGASEEPGSVGAGLVAALVEAGFTGTLAAVNPGTQSGARIAELSTYASIRDVPSRVDLAVVAVPAAALPQVVRECAAAGVRGLVVVTTLGERGGQAERELLALARAGGMRVLGPESLGVVNTDPGVRLDASLSSVRSLPGRVGFASHAGPLALPVLEAAAARGLGLSSAVSMGARVDVSGNDLLQFWGDDERTEVIALHLESFGNPRKFGRLARRVGRTTPVVVLASGRARGATSAALFRQAGVVTVDTFQQLYDVMALLACQPLPVGRCVAVVGTSVSLNSLGADALTGLGLDVSRRDDLPFDAPPGVLREAVVAAARDAHAVLALVVPPYGSDGTELAAVLPAAASEAGGEVPVLAVWLGVQGLPEPLRATTSPDDDHQDGVPARGSVPSFTSPDAAAIALLKAAQHAEWRRAPQGETRELPDVQPVRARHTVEVLQAGRVEEAPLGPGPARELLASYGIGLTPSSVVTDVERAVRRARVLRYPVALKVAAGPLRHRVEGGGVRLDLVDEGALRRAWAHMQERLGEGMLPCIVQPMVPPGVPVIVQLVADPVFGPVLTTQIGGTVRDVAPERAARIVPLTDTDAADLVTSMPGAHLLTGSRGGPVLDTAGLEDLLLRLSRLSEDVPELVSLALDPVVVSEHATHVLAVEGTLGAASPDPDTGPRRLRPLD